MEAGVILWQQQNFFGVITNEAKEHYYDRQIQDFKSKLEGTIAIIRKKMQHHLPPDILQATRDHRFVFMLDRLTVRDGFFVSPHAIPREYNVIPRDRERELHLVMHPRFLSKTFVSHVLMHEFFHAIHFALNPFERVWVKEGLAEVFNYILSKKINLSSFQKMQADPLTPLRAHYKVNTPPSQYGHNLMYFYYLTRECGGIELFWQLASGGLKRNDLSQKRTIHYGSRLIDLLLKKRTQYHHKEQCRSYKSSMISFELARIHNQIREVDDNPRRYFLHPTKRGREHYQINDPEAFSKLPKESSAIINYQLMRDHADSEKAHFFWAASEPPYQVETLKPPQIKASTENDSRWQKGLIILIKY